MHVRPVFFCHSVCSAWPSYTVYQVSLSSESRVALRQMRLTTFFFFPPVPLLIAVHWKPWKRSACMPRLYLVNKLKMERNSDQSWLVALILYFMWNGTSWILSNHTCEGIMQTCLGGNKLLRELTLQWFPFGTFPLISLLKIQRTLWRGSGWSCKSPAVSKKKKKRLRLVSLGQIWLLIGNACIVGWALTVCSFYFCLLGSKNMSPN